jgi:capsular polysaccharide transport system ATP-binding protein
MIFLQNVTKCFKTANASSFVFANLTTVLDPSSGNLVILGQSRAGKSTLINLLSGATAPSQGRIVYGARVSWPLGWRGFSSNFTAEESLGFLAKIYGADHQAMMVYTNELSGLDEKLFEPMGKLKTEEKSRLMLAAAYGLDFDIYLLDGNMPKVGAEFEPRFKALWLEKLRQNRVILATGHIGSLDKNFSQAMIIHHRSLSPAMPLDLAAQQFGLLARR